MATINLPGGMTLLKTNRSRFIPDRLASVKSVNELFSLKSRTCGDKMTYSAQVFAVKSSERIQSPKRSSDNFISVNGLASAVSLRSEFLFSSISLRMSLPVFIMLPETD